MTVDQELRDYFHKMGTRYSSTNNNPPVVGFGQVALIVRVFNVQAGGVGGRPYIAVARGQLQMTHGQLGNMDPQMVGMNAILPDIVTYPGDTYQVVGQVEYMLMALETLARWCQERGRPLPT